MNEGGAVETSIFYFFCNYYPAKQEMASEVATNGCIAASNVQEYTQK